MVQRPDEGHRFPDNLQSGFFDIRVGRTDAKDTREYFLPRRDRKNALRPTRPGEHGQYYRKEDWRRRCVASETEKMSKHVHANSIAASVMPALKPSGGYLLQRECA